MYSSPFVYYTCCSMRKLITSTYFTARPAATHTTAAATATSAAATATSAAARPLTGTQIATLVNAEDDDDDYEDAPHDPNNFAFPPTSGVPGPISLSRSSTRANRAAISHAGGMQRQTAPDVPAQAPQRGSILQGTVRTRGGASTTSSQPVGPPAGRVPAVNRMGSSQTQSSSSQTQSTSTGNS